MNTYGRIYRVTFEAHRNCKIFNYVYHVWAWDIPEAKELTKTAWEKGQHKAYPFHMTAKRISGPNDEDLLYVTGWKGNTYTGKECMDFICTDFRAWRVNGINQYGPRAGQHYRA